MGQKQLDRTPHSARNGLVINSISSSWTSPQQALDPRQPSENRSTGVRWDQASPYRVRYVGATSSSSVPKNPGPFSAGQLAANRGLLGPPPKTAPPSALLGARLHSKSDVGPQVQPSQVNASALGQALQSFRVGQISKSPMTAMPTKGWTS